MIKLVTNPRLLIFLPIVLIISNLFVPVLIYNIKLRNAFLLIISTAFFISISLLENILENIAYINFELFSFSNLTIAFHVENMGIIFLNLIAILWVLSLLYTINYLEFNIIPNQNRFLFFFNLSILIGNLLVISANLFSMLVFYELLTLTTIPLIIIQNTEKTIKGVSKYLKILLTTSMFFFLPAIAIIYAKIGHGNFIMNGILSDKFLSIHSILLLLMFIFGISKTAVFPFSSWLPAAMVASYPVSALLHSVLIVNAGLFCIFKILIYIFGLQYLQFLFHNNNYLIFIPIITIFYGAFMAIRTANIKEILAYSTITQLSISLLSAFLFTTHGVTAAIYHMISHSFSKITLFYAIGIIYSLKRVYYVNDLPNISKEIRLVSFIILLAILSLIGIPPLAGFFSKFHVMQAAHYSNNIIALIVIALSSILSAIYLSRLLSVYYKKEIFNIENKELNSIANKSYPMVLSTCCCVIGVIGFYAYYHNIDYYLTGLLNV